MRHLQTLVLAAAIASGISACASDTVVKENWKAASATNVKFQKIIVVCMSKDVAFRRSVEDNVVKRVKRSVAAYTVLPEAELRSPERARQVFLEQGFDGAILLRLVGVHKETTIEPSTAYSTPYGYGPMWGGTGYYNYGWGPGYVETDEVVTMDTNVYTVADGKLLWASRSKTYNPDDVPELVEGIVEETADKMRDEHLIE